MTPPAATAAGRRPARTAYAPAAPRRVSGPVAQPETRRPARPAKRPSRRATAAAVAFETAFAPAFEPTFAPAPARTRRETAPARAPYRTRLPREAPQRRARARELPRLDRVVRGRAWIPVLGALLVVIVGMRVEVLKLGSSVGRQLEQATALESGNAALRAQVSELSGNQRIEQLAAAMGMLMPGPMDIHFVGASPTGNVAAAIRGFTRPRRRPSSAESPSERQTDASNTSAAANISAIGGLSNGAVATPTTGHLPAGTTTGGTTTAGATSGTPTTGTGTLQRRGDQHVHCRHPKYDRPGFDVHGHR